MGRSAGKRRSGHESAPRPQKDVRLTTECFTGCRTPNPYASHVLSPEPFTFQMNLTGSTIPLRRFAALLAVPVLFVLAVSGVHAQQLSNQGQQGEHVQRAVDGLTQELNLTTSQAQIVAIGLRSGPVPVALWGVSAELTPTLTATQKSLLSVHSGRGQEQNRPERSQGGDYPNRPERTQGVDHPSSPELTPSTDGVERPQRSDRPRRSDQSGVSNDRRAAYRLARSRALGLSNEQSSRLDDIDERRRADGRTPDDNSEAAAPILTPHQLEIVRVYHGLHERIQNPTRPTGPGLSPVDGPGRVR